MASSRRPRRPRAPSSSSAVMLLGLGLGGFTTSTQAFLMPQGRPSSMRTTPTAVLVREAAGTSSGEPIKVTPEMIKHTATLAQLNFDDAEIAALVPRFQAFLGFVDKMREVPDGTPGMAPGSLPPVEEVLRADSPAFFANQDAIFANMAQQEDAYLVVPKVGEEDV